MLKKLKNHYNSFTSQNLEDLFKLDNKRFNKYSLKASNLFLDYSKNWINTETFTLYEKYFEKIDFNLVRHQMFNGEKINFTENRAVLHTALRNSKNNSIYVEGKNIIPLIRKELKKIDNFCNEVHSGSFKGFSGKSIKYIINIGIGGSDLGPSMVSEALKPFHSSNLPQVYYVSNIDSADLIETIKNIDIDRSLFLIASKTFTTQETMENAKLAKQMVLDHYKGDIKSISSHFIALSTNKNAVKEFGINLEYMFQFWDWVGGRYSLWSTIGLSIALYLGMDNFKKLLAGAEDMDNHFRSAPINENMPIILAILGFGYNNFMGLNSHAILPYAQYLNRFTAFIQQLDMESNGKSVNKNGNLVDIPTGPIIWGEPGTNGQHAFYQLLHQGTQKVPCDFIAIANSQHGIDHTNNILLANCIAQSQALLKGRSLNKVINEMELQGLSKNEINKMAPHKVFQGNRPSNTIILKELNPRSLGSLIALYEHKVFTQGIMWNINSFDQYGVELGKLLTNEILSELNNNNSMINNNSFDSSTNGLISFFKMNQ
ncbi:MAG: glucose-6-phosphate isomerase [Candidatus Marinimicrobia bacterium]|nr:glucose-6-phosphate isomerase [Candidatus Neomarinimicrobiota bacterium]|tara:strand:- start:4268 stop:5899 length:1632 start_codon:yes stop_codon:yes gene_type:complete